MITMIALMINGDDDEGDDVDRYDDYIDNYHGDVQCTLYMYLLYM